jgi:four helix bundle protein
MQKAYMQLVAFQRADNLVAIVYQATRELPPEEICGLVLRMRQVACAIPLSIIEGYAKASRQEFYEGVKHACASLAELEYLVDLSLRLGYIRAEMHSKLFYELTAVNRSLYGLLEGARLTASFGPGKLAETAASYVC